MRQDNAKSNIVRQVMFKKHLEVFKHLSQQFELNKLDKFNANDIT